MKSEERRNQEREKRKGLYILLGVCFIFFILIAMLIFSFTGGQGNINNFIQPIINYLKEIFSEIWFKISNFLSFLKRGI